MANRMDRRKQDELDKLTQQDTAAINYFSPSTLYQAKGNFEDLVLTLASAYENKRERQVIEWEILRRRSLSV